MTRMDMVVPIMEAIQDVHNTSIEIACADITDNSIRPDDIVRKLYGSCNTFKKKIAIMTVLRLSTFDTCVFDGCVELIRIPFVEECLKEWKKTRRLLNSKRQIYLCSYAELFSSAETKRIGVWK